MKIEITPGTTRDDAIYAIKDRVAGTYLDATWDTSTDGSISWYFFKGKVTMVSRRLDVAERRFAAIGERIRSDLDRMVTRSDRHQLIRLLDGDLVLVRINIDLTVRETTLP
jgi:hypothetical protein